MTIGELIHDKLAKGTDFENSQLCPKEYSTVEISLTQLITRKITQSEKFATWFNDRSEESQKAINKAGQIIKFVLHVLEFVFVNIGLIVWHFLAEAIYTCGINKGKFSDATAKIGQMFEGQFNQTKLLWKEMVSKV